MEDQFTLAQLAERLGMHPRTIRSYIEQNLLRGPEIGGRGARYSEYHVQRLQAIRTLKDLRGLPLAEVRRRLLVLTAQELALLAQEAEDTRSPVPAPGELSALSYLKSLKPNSYGEPDFTATLGPPTAIDVLLGRLDRMAGGANPARRARGEVWTSVPVTPDIEIRVRGTQTADELSRWERIADYVREILIGKKL